MDPQKPRTETIRHKNAIFDLKATYQVSMDDKEEDRQDKLDIYLKVNSQSGQQAYRSTFSDQNAPPQVINVFSELQIAFECFRQESGFQIDLENGKIFIKGIFDIKGRKIEKRALVPLAKYEISELQSMVEHVRELQNEINTLKEDQEKRDLKLRKQYEQKFQEEKKKFQEALRLANEKENKSKDKQIEASIREMNKMLNELRTKIDEFSHGSIKEIQDLRNKAQQYQKDIKKAKTQLEGRNDMKQGKEPRKMRKIENYKTLAIRSENKLVSQKDSQIPKQINHKLFNIDKFYFNRNLITYIDEYKTETKILWNTVLPRTEFKFEVKIIKCTQSILVGIAKQTEPLRLRFCDKNNYAYEGKTGYIWGLNKFQGNGFKVNDTVQMIVQLNRPYIEWRVNGQIEASCQPTDFPNELTVPMVPFIEMEYTGDCIAWKIL